jgi:hypothetical protein
MTLRCLIESKYVSASPTSEFAATSKTIIDKLTATNVGGASATLTLHLVPSGSSVSVSNRILEVEIEVGKTYLCGEAVGHILEAGDGITVGASAALSLVLRASGREEVS